MRRYGPSTTNEAKPEKAEAAPLGYCPACGWSLHEHYSGMRQCDACGQLVEPKDAVHPTRREG